MFDYLNNSIMKKVLVYGLGITGISSVKTLSTLGYDVYTYDKNKENIESLKGYSYSPISDSRLKDEKFSFVVKSPGIKPDDKIVKELEKNNEIVSDIELSYRLFPKKETIAITGTNGKTTTTSMISHILNKSGKKAICVGNIGEGILWQMLNNDAVFVEEISSFQLHDTSLFHPHIAAILNITEDHFDWHGNFENYINCKLNIAKNQNENDYLIINLDDEITQKNKNKFKAKIYEFSTKSKPKRGMYLKENKIFYVDENEDREYLNFDDMTLVGKHNIENTMATILALKLFGLSESKIIENAKTFKAISHRLEFFKKIDGVDFYDDSKATNVDSAIKALDSFEKNVILIAGGYDKDIDYSPLIEKAKSKVKTMVLIGETKYTLENLCKKENIKSIVTDNMKDCVKTIFDIMKENDIVLLSPASASWDMYESYAKRGEDFKNEVLKQEEDRK